MDTFRVRYAISWLEKADDKYPKLINVDSWLKLTASILNQCGKFATNHLIILPCYSRTLIWICTYRIGKYEMPVTSWGLEPTLEIQLGGTIPESGAMCGLVSCFVVGAIWWAGPIQCFSSVEYSRINIMCTLNTLNTKLCITTSPEQKFRLHFPNSYSAYWWCCYV